MLISAYSGLYCRHVSIKNASFKMQLSFFWDFIHQLQMQEVKIFQNLWIHSLQLSTSQTQLSVTEAVANVWQ